MADFTRYIRNLDDLKAAWLTLHFIEKTFAELQNITKSDAAKTQAFVKELKQTIREYNHRQTDRRIITGDYEGYIELIILPECFDTSLSEKEVAEWFDENERLICMPSIYDCTGQAFTMWYKAFKRRGRWMLYHKVGFDV